MRIYTVSKEPEWFEQDYFRKIFQTILIEYDQGVIMGFIDRYLSLIVKRTIPDGSILGITDRDQFLVCLNKDNNIDLDHLEFGLLDYLDSKGGQIKDSISIIIPEDIVNQNEFEERLIKIVDLSRFNKPIFVRKMSTIEKMFKLHS